jgi:hypothetical protein
MSNSIVVLGISGTGARERRDCRAQGRVIVKATYHPYPIAADSLRTRRALRLGPYAAAAVGACVAWLVGASLDNLQQLAHPDLVSKPFARGTRQS